jgi:D-lactate dehydrogenase (cytochrome)
MAIEILELGEAHADYLHDESRREGYADRIAFPRTADEVGDALRMATENHWPVTVQGGRTGITGGCVPEGGLVLNLSRMDAIGKIAGDRLAVQPGATLAAIRAAIAGSGLFFPSDLTETSATIGGMVANNASGARSFRYGSVRNWIHALDVVLPQGATVRLVRGEHRANGWSFTLGSVTGNLCAHLRKCGPVKTAAGYFIEPDMDLVDLFIGAEGTLGVVTGITIKLLPVPEQMNGLTAFFASEDEALRFVRFLRTAGRGPRPTAIEFFDPHALELLRRMKAEHPAFTDLPELAAEFDTALYFEFDCEVPDAVAEEVDRTAIECWISEGEHEIGILKNFRHAIPESVNLIIGERKKAIPELTKLGTDMSVPDSRLEEVMRMYHAGLAQAGLEYVIFGHIGNNHVHVNILPRNMEEYDRGKALYLDWAKQVVEWEGSVSAEHGIGKLKTGFLALMAGDQGIAEMQGLKRLFDPQRLLNRGNLFGS